MQAVRLLVVDDDDVDRDKLRRLLARDERPFEIVEATSGREAIERLRAFDFDCVILDYRLGDTLGTDLISDIEASARHSCPVIMVTGQSSERGAVEALRRGIYDYLPKRELKREQLLAAIEGSLRWAEMQGQLSESEHRFQQLSESLPLLVWSSGPDGQVDYLGRQWVEYTAIPAEEQLGDRWLSQVHPDDRDAVAAAWRNAVESGTEFDMEYRIRRADGMYRWFKTRTALLRDTKGRIVRRFGTNTDVHEARELRAAITHALEEKTVLLNEVHHRVKNNLQIISGLLRLQARRCAVPEVTPLLEQSQLRIQAMGLIHQLLYESKDFAQVDLSYYLRRLIDLLHKTFAAGDGRVQIVTEFNPVHLSLDIAVPCGLLVTELLSNAFKHAFPAERRGEIRVALGRRDGTAILSVSDTGVGMPAGLSVTSAQSLGLKLVELLTDQIGGTISLDEPPGTHYQLRFPVR